MKAPHRISLELLDSNLSELINASAKIFPVNYTYITSNTNVDNYEYVRIVDGVHRNEIYIWRIDVFEWELIGADDVEIFWDDVLNKPIVYTPDEHTHTKSSITDFAHIHTIAEISDFAHIHDDRYYTESEITTLMVGKADKTSLDGHVGNSTVHVTQTNKDTWNNKADIELGVTQPINNALWYKEI